MKLKLKRIFKGNEYTIGRLYINGKYFSDTIEDTDRGLLDSMPVEQIKELKIKHKTAIPRGTYRVLLTYSPKFNRILPILLNVKGFTGIRIHNGFNQNSTSGCIIVGKNTIKGGVTSSTITLIALLDSLEEASKNNEIITITIK